MLVDTYVDWVEALLLVEGVRMLVTLSPPTDQRQLAHYVCIAERLRYSVEVRQQSIVTPYSEGMTSS